jgi:hypothetical protein
MRLMGVKALGVGLALLTPFPASGEILCVRGGVYIQDAQIVPPSDIVARNVKSHLDCPADSASYVQNTEKRVLSSTEIRRIRDGNKEVAEKGEDRK